MSDPLNAGRWKLVAVMSTLGMVGALLAAFLDEGWRAALAMTGAELLAVIVYWARTRDPLMGRLLWFGCIVGFGELPTDAYSVLVKGTLVYPPHEPHIWASPAYMPLSWVAVMVQGAFMAWALRQKIGAAKAALIMAAIGGTYVPLYEYLARNANFWYYRDCPLLFGHTPHYVILAEALLVGTLPFLVKGLPSAGWARVTWIGVVQSAVILGSTVLAFALVG